MSELNKVTVSLDLSEFMEVSKGNNKSLSITMDSEGRIRIGYGLMQMAGLDRSVYTYARVLVNRAGNILVIVPSTEPKDFILRYSEKATGGTYISAKSVKRLLKVDFKGYLEFDSYWDSKEKYFVGKIKKTVE